FKEASSRRDFTINAMAIDVRTGELLDAHEGFIHLKQKLLKHVSSAFVEDPLRVLRAAQFSARFDLTLDQETVLLCQKLQGELQTLSRERIFEEMKKLLLAKKPSLGLKVLRETYALSLFPELEAMIDCPQDKEWHPEGDVWTHTLMVVDQAAILCERSSLDTEQRLIVMAGALCHDIGKPPTTKEIDGRIRSLAHDEVGVSLAESFLTRMAFPERSIEDVTSLVKEHLKPYQLYKTRDSVSDGAIKRLTLRVDIDRLLLVSQADFLGRTTKDALNGVDPSYAWLRDKVKALLGKKKAPEPLLLGRHLIALGYKPGPDFGELLEQAFEAQLDGAFDTLEGAIAWFKANLGK
ncbi:MAG TPA: HD domain-containing protein, partial [Myxococcota bacterium]|nr:HD domain-containing protein [Myxococcota bacterium]